MTESITSFRFESHMIKPFSDEGQGEDVQRKCEKRKRKELAGGKKKNLNFFHFELAF